MNEIDAIISSALRQNRKTLSEWESARLLTGFGIPMAKGILAQNWDETRKAAADIGYPVVLKACSPEVSHKTEGGLVAVDLHNETDLDAAFRRISAAMPVKDAAYLGGIFTEILGDVTFRPAPLSEADAAEMIREIKGCKILDALRGMAAVDADALVACLMAVGRIGVECEEIQAIDINPLIIQDGGQAGRPVAVDALVILKGETS
jgi:acyl-CoA synthetase (NDP forming)